MILLIGTLVCFCLQFFYLGFTAASWVYSASPTNLHSLADLNPSYFIHKPHQCVTLSPVPCFLGLSQ